MKAAKVLSVLLGLLLVYMVACPLVEAISSSFATHDCHGEQNHQNGQTTSLCCRDAGIVASKVQLNQDHSIVLVMPHCPIFLYDMKAASFLSSSSAPLYLTNSSHVTLLSVLRI
jgi:hypothetical protein